MKRFLAIVLAAMLSASVLAMPIHAVDGIPDSAYQPFVETVEEKFKDEKISGSLQKIYFVCEERKGISPPDFNLHDVEWMAVEYIKDEKTVYSILRKNDSDFILYCNEVRDEYDKNLLNRFLSLNSTLCYDYKTGTAEFLQATLTSSEIDEQKKFIINTILPFVKNSGLNPLKIYSLHLPDPVSTPGVNGKSHGDLEGFYYLAEYQSIDGHYFKQIRYDEKEQKWTTPLTKNVNTSDWLINIITNGKSTVIYDCSSGEIFTNPFKGTVNKNTTSESDSMETPPESSSGTEAPSFVEPEPISKSDSKIGWKKENGIWYVYQNGQMLKSEWYEDNSKWYYLNSNGAMSTGWQDISGKRYHFDSSGVMQTGWRLIDGNWYYFKGSGEMATGWLQIQSGDPWYYLKSDGKMVVGWSQIGGKWYCFNQNGEMYANTTTPDGFQVGADGTMVEEKSSFTENSTQSSSENANSSNSQEERAYRDAGYAIAYFRRKLRDPNSLIPRMLSSTLYTNGLTAVFGEISGTNAFGGYASDMLFLYVYEGKVYEVYDCDPIQDKVDQAYNMKGNMISLDCDKVLDYEP